MTELARGDQSVFIQVIHVNQTFVAVDPNCSETLNSMAKVQFWCLFLRFRDRIVVASEPQQREKTLWG